MTTFTTTSPTSAGALPEGVTEIGGVVLDLIGLNGVRVVCQLPASSLFVGMFDSGTPEEYQGNPGTIGIQEGFTPEIIAALGGGLSEAAVRITLYDGDTAPGDFDQNDNTLSLNGVSFGDFSAVTTQQTSANGNDLISSGTGFGNNILSTGWFFSNSPTALASLYASLSSGNVAFELTDDGTSEGDEFDNFFDFTQGVDGGLVDVGSPPNASPTSSNDTVATAEDTTKILSLDDFGAYDDPEDTPIAAVKITALETNGSLEYDTTGSGAWAAVTLNQEISAAHITAGRLRFVPDGNENGSPYATIGFKVSDGSAYSAAAYTLTVNVTAVNDAPTAIDDFFGLTPDGFDQQDSQSGHSYFFNETYLSWADARDAAESFGGHLATIPWFEENTFIYETFIQPLEGGDDDDWTPWIGASDAAVEGEWRWVTGPEAGFQFWQGNASGTPLGFDNWSPGQPDDNGSNEDYAEMWPGGAWNDAPGEGGHFSIVEFSPPNEDSTAAISKNFILDNDTDPDGPGLSISGVDDSDLGADVWFDDETDTVFYDPANSETIQGLSLGEYEDDTFDYQVTDGEHTDTGTVTVRVWGRNDAPVVELAGGGDEEALQAAFLAVEASVTLDYTEGDAPAPVAPGAEVSDVDTDNFAGGSLTVTFSENGTIDDLLGVEDQGTGEGEISVTGDSVFYEDSFVGTFTYTPDEAGGSLVVDFGGGESFVSAEAVQALIRAIVFSNGSDDPSTDPRTVLFTLVDGDGAGYGGTDTAVATATINVFAENDAPISGNDTVSTAEDTAKILSLNDFGAYSDTEETPIAAVKITALETNGSLEYDTTGSGGWAPVTLNQEISATHIAAGRLRFVPDGNENGSPYTTIGFKVGDGSDFSAAPNTLTVNVTAVNDAPSGTNKTVTTLEDTPRSFSAADFGFSDASDSPANALLAVKITSLPAASTGVLKLNGVAVTAGQSVAAADLDDLQFVPAANKNGSASFTFQVQDNGGTANGGANLDPIPNTLTVSVTPVNDAPSGTNNNVTTLEDTARSFSAADFGFSDASDSPANALLAVKITTLPAASAGVLKLNGVAVAAGQSIAAADLDDLQFVPAANKNGSASFTFQVQDNGGTANGGANLDPIPNTLTVSVTPVNDAPSGTNNNVTTLEDTARSFSAADFGFSDSSDSPANTLLAVKITTLPAASAGVLKLNGVAVAAGQSIAASQLDDLLFIPAANKTGSASFTFQVQDNGGTANGGANLDATPNTLTVNVHPVNDAPSGTNRTVTILEDTARSFSAADFGFSDSSDSPANTLLAVKITTLPAASAGVLKLNGVAVAAGQSIAASQLDDLLFIPAANKTGSASFTFQVQDNGGTANGGANLDATPNTLTVNVHPVNDAPSGTNKTVTTLEDTARSFSAADFGFSDSSDSPANTLLAVKITTLPAASAGVLKLNGVAIAAGQSIPASQLDDLFFIPAANKTGSASFTFQVQDNGGTANGGANLDATPNTLTVNVHPVNDAPSGTNKTVTILEDTARSFSAADFGFSDSSDSPANTLLAVKITTLPAASAGVLKLNGVAVTAGQSIPASQLDDLFFIPAANRTGSASFITFQVQDNGGTANGGANLDATPNALAFSITPVNDAPVAAPDAARVNEGAGVTGNVIAGAAGGAGRDTDIDGTSLSIKGVVFQGTGGGSAAPGAALKGQFGTLVVKADGSYTYTGNPNSSALVAGETGTDRFLYTLVDAGGATSTATLTVSVIGQNLVITNGSGDLFGQRGDDNITGDGGVNRIRGFEGNDRLDGGGGNDQLWGDQGNDQMFGGSGNDDLAGDDGDDTLRLGADNDRGWGGIGNDSIFGEAGDDSIQGEDGNDLLDGGDGNDLVYGGAGDDTIFLGIGNDIGDGGTGNDVINGGDGVDQITAGTGNDTLRGDAGNDLMWGDDGNDIFFGGTGNDQYAGGAGTDTLNFDSGVDTGWGGADNDVFTFVRGQAAGDSVQDFFGNGASAGDRFVFQGYGTAAQGATFTQVDATHWQIHSADGSVNEVITLANGAAVHASDFSFI